jgi:hypothetical protein
MRSFRLGVCLLMISCNGVFAAPQQLYGKSIVVTWTESREQKAAYESSLHSVSRDGNFSIYVSSEGRVFNRFSYGGSDNGKYMQSSSSQIAGQPSDLHARNINFQGSTITVTMPMVAGARQIVARFEGDFANCNAQVITGKASPQSPIKMRTLNAGNAEFEIHSIRTGAATCKVQTGNVFAN